MDKFRDRVVVITGGAGGIGLALARALAARGSNLVIADLDANRLREAEKTLADEGACVLGVETDVADLASVRSLGEAVRRRFGGAHIVCNNAGVATLGELARATHRDWEFTMNVNFWGVVHGTETFVPMLLEQGAGGHVVNTASMAGLVGMQGMGIYTASKFAVVGLSEALYRELRPHGIGVSVLCPMIVDTKIAENSHRMRPVHLRNESGTEAAMTGELAGGAVSPEHVARRTVRAIERGDLYIVTHPEQRELLRRRAGRLDAMFKEDIW